MDKDCAGVTAPGSTATAVDSVEETKDTHETSSISTTAAPTSSAAVEAAGVEAAVESTLQAAVTAAVEAAANAAGPVGITITPESSSAPPRVCVVTVTALQLQRLCASRCVGWSA